MNSIKLSLVIGCGLFAIWPETQANAAPAVESTPADAVGEVAEWNKLNRRYLDALVNAGSPVPDGVWLQKTGAIWYTEADGTLVQHSFSMAPAGLTEVTRPLTVDLARGTITQAYSKFTWVFRITAEQAHTFTIETVSQPGTLTSSDAPPFKAHVTAEVIEISDPSGKALSSSFWTSRAEALAQIKSGLQGEPAVIATSQTPHGFFGEGGRSFAFEIEGNDDALTVRNPFGTWVYRRQAGNLYAYNDHYTLQVVDAEHIVWNQPGQVVDDDPMVYQKMDPVVAKEQIRITNKAIADVHEEMDAIPYVPYEESGSGDSSSSDSPLKATYDALVQANAEAGAHLAQTQAHYDEVMDQAREQAALERAQAEGVSSDSASDVSSQDVANARAATERQYEAERRFQAEQARRSALRVEEVAPTTVPTPPAPSAPAAASPSQQGPRMGFDGRDCDEARGGAQHWVGTDGTYEVESTETKPDGWCHIIIKNWHSTGAASFQ